MRMMIILTKNRKEKSNMDELIDRMNKCQTMRELDNLRIEIVRAG